MAQMLFTGASEQDVKAQKLGAAKVKIKKQQEKEQKQRREYLQKYGEIEERSAVKNAKKAVGKALPLGIFSGLIISGLLGATASIRVDLEKEEGSVIDDWVAKQFVSGYSYKYAKEHGYLFSFWANVIFTTVFSAIVFKKHAVRMYKNTQSFSVSEDGVYLKKIVDQLSKNPITVANIDKYLDGIENVGLRKIVLDMVKNLAKNDAQIFETYINNPLDIHNQEMALAVVRGKLMTDTNILDRLFNAFDPASIPAEIRDMYEQHRKSKDISWDQAVALYSRTNNRNG